MADLNIIGRFVDQTKPGVDSAERRVGGLRGALQRVTPSARTAGLAIAGIAAAGVAIGVKLVADVISTSRELSAFAERAAVSAEALQEWGRIAEESGGSVEDVADGHARDEPPALGSGGAGQRTRRGRAGPPRPLPGGPQGPGARGAVPPHPGRHRGHRGPGPQATFAAEELLGGSSERLTALLQENAAGFREQEKAARDAGGILSNETVEAGKEAGLALDKIKQALSGVANDGVAVVLPLIIEFANYLADNLGPVIRDDIKPAIDDFLVVVKDLEPVFRVAFEVSQGHRGDGGRAHRGRLLSSWSTP